MKTLLRLILILWPGLGIAQDFYGFRHLQTRYQGDTVDILVKSRAGEEHVKKPILFFCQGSLPVPLILTYTENGAQKTYGTFPFNPDTLTAHYHVVIVGKPGVPLVCTDSLLDSGHGYVDSTGHYPAAYLSRNRLDYYLARDKAVIRFLQKQSWVSPKGLVLAGHSEGSYVAAKLAMQTPGVARLIYSGGNPMGRIMSLMERSRATETDSTPMADFDVAHWKAVLRQPNRMDNTAGDTYKVTYQFSQPILDSLLRLKIPVFVSYGSRDAGAPFNDYLQIESIRRRRTNFTFYALIGAEHNYFPLLPDGKPDYDVFNWDKVAGEWAQWLASSGL